MKESMTFRRQQAPTPKRGCQSIIGPNFAENCIKNEELCTKREYADGVTILESLKNGLQGQSGVGVIAKLSQIDPGVWCKRVLTLKWCLVMYGYRSLLPQTCRPLQLTGQMRNCLRFVAILLIQCPDLKY